MLLLAYLFSSDPITWQSKKKKKKKLSGLFQADLQHLLEKIIFYD